MPTSRIASSSRTVPVGLMSVVYSGASKLTHMQKPSPKTWKPVSEIS
jgi:hypothetical protein